jgi:hypothetical protein
MANHKTFFEVYITPILAIIALILSTFTFVDTYFFNVHNLKAGAYGMEFKNDTLSCKILLTNQGKSDEVLYTVDLMIEDFSYKWKLYRFNFEPIVVSAKQSLIKNVFIAKPNFHEFIYKGIKDSSKVIASVYFVPLDKIGRLSLFDSKHGEREYFIGYIQLDSIGNIMHVQQVFNTRPLVVLARNQD